jgi:hypothetical protein
MNNKTETFDVGDTCGTCGEKFNANDQMYFTACGNPKHSVHIHCWVSYCEKQNERPCNTTKCPYCKQACSSKFVKLDWMGNDIRQPI